MNTRQANKASAPAVSGRRYSTGPVMRSLEVLGRLRLADYSLLALGVLRRISLGLVVQVSDELAGGRSLCELRVLFLLQVYGFLGFTHLLTGRARVYKLLRHNNHPVASDSSIRTGPSVPARLTARPTGLVAISLHSRGASMARRSETFARRPSHGAYSSADRITGILPCIGHMSELGSVVIMATEPCSCSPANVNGRSVLPMDHTGDLPPRSDRNS